MKQHRQQIVGDLSSCEPKEKALFAFLAADRLRNCCWAFEGGNGGRLEPFFRWNDVLIDFFRHSDPLDSDLLQSAFRELEGIVPRGEKPLFVQVQSAVICLLAAVDILGNGTRLGVIDSVNAIVDALDNFDFFVRRRILNDSSRPTDYLLLEREKRRQLEDVQFVKRLGFADESTLAEYLYNNAQFMIPIAV